MRVLQCPPGDFLPQECPSFVVAYPPPPPPPPPAPPRMSQNVCRRFPCCFPHRVCVFLNTRQTAATSYLNGLGVG